MHPAVEHRLRGATYEDVGRALGLTHEGARQAVLREQRRYLDELETTLLLNLKTGDSLVFVVSLDDPAAFDFSVEHLRWVVSELRDRGLDLSIDYVPKPDGVAFAIVDKTDYAGLAGSKKEKS